MHEKMPLLLLLTPPHCGCECLYERTSHRADFLMGIMSNDRRVGEGEWLGEGRVVGGGVRWERVLCERHSHSFIFLFNCLGLVSLVPVFTGILKSTNLIG